MSSKESKRSKARRKLYSAPANVPTSMPSWPSATPKPFQPFGNGVTMNVNEVATEFGLTLKSSNADAERITELMDAPVDLDIAAHAISRGPNPYLDRCMHCSALRPDTQEGDEGLELLDLQLDGNTVISRMAQPFSSFKLEIWTCADCRKVAKNFQSFLAYDLPFVSDKEIDSPLSFTKTKEEKENCSREELQDNWVELKSLVRDIYASEEEPNLTPEQEKRLKFLVDKLCCIDPHQLFLGLEAQVREIVSEIKTCLLTKLKENGCDKPELALDFTSSLLSYYDLLTKKAHLLAQYLGGLSSHLKRFEVTWELLNKHLFHSIAHNDPAISNSGPTILEQLRQGSVQYEKSKDDPYCLVRKRLLKFQEEMSVVVVVWRDCQQLIENYCHEEFKNTHKHVSSKTKSFISQQRQLLKDHLQKEPFSGEALSETMKNLMAGHKSSMERVMCHRCKRERCTCDECTITHRITCGIINSDMGGEHPPNAFNFALDHTRNVMDITPPSMSSTTSSSGSVSPINIEDKLTTFYDHRDEFSDALLSCEDREGKAMSLNGDGNYENGEDEEADDEDEGDEDEYGDVQDAGGDEPHSLQDPAFLWEAMQEHQREQLRQQHVYLERLNHHNCSHRHPGKSDQVCPFQPPIDPKLSRELDAELAKSGLLPKGAGDITSSDILSTSEGEAESKGGGDGANSLVNPALCATCQCHACLKQSGHVVSTSLPLQVTASPSPADLHLYPHIHGLPQQDPKSYMFDLPHLMSSIKLPVKIDFDDPAGLQDHFYHAYSDWDSTMQPRPGSLAAQHQHQHHQRLSGHSSDLLPPPPLDTAAPPFTFDLASHLATHTTHTSTTNTTSAFKSVTGKHFASSIMPSLSNVGNITSEGSSVDPSKPLDFASLAKIPQSCLNGTGAFPAASFSPSSASCVSSSSGPLSSVSGVPVTSKANGTCQGPPCSRPTPLGGNATTSKWEKGHPPHCKKFTGGHLSKQQLATAATAQQHQHNLGSQPLSGAVGQPFSSAALKNLFPSPLQQKEEARGKGGGRGVLPCSVAPTPASRPGGLTDQPESMGVPVPTSSAAPGIASMVSNIGVGTSGPCTDPECEVHHGEDNCDSVDDSCSEKSSSTTTSNQKEGKYCDCCYCEFFGHNNAATAKTSTNYIETKDRLRKILKKRQNEGKHKSDDAKSDERLEDDTHDPLEKKGLEGLLRFINGLEDDSGSKGKEKELSAKAAKRARQKQKKLQEKAKLVENFALDSNNASALKQFFQSRSQKCEHQFANGLELTMTIPNFKKQPGNTEKKEMQPEKAQYTGTVLEQEINRKSFIIESIIESTRPTISVPKKEEVKVSCPSQRSAPGGTNAKETSQTMINFLGALQSMGKSKGPGQAQSSTAADGVTPGVHTSNNGTSNKTGLTPSKDVARQNGTLGQQQREKQQQRSGPQQPSSQPTSAQQKTVQQQQKTLQHQHHRQQGQQTLQQQQHKQQGQSTLQQHKQQGQPTLQQQHKQQGQQTLQQHKQQGQQTLQQQQHKQLGQQTLQQHKQQGQQQKQQQPATKSVNGKSPAPVPQAAKKVPAASTQASHKAVNGKVHPPLTSSSNGVNNGRLANGHCAVSSKGSPVTQAPAPTVSAKSSVQDSPSTGSGSSASQSPSCGAKVTADQGKANGKSKKKKKNKNGGINCVDEIFMPKSESELDGDVDDFERELEEFKRFCFEPAEPKERRKIAVNVNLKDIFKKKTGLV